MQLYFFGWPSPVGGAGTKLSHLLDLLCPHYEITVVPNTAERLEDRHWRDWLAQRHIQCCLFDDLPDRLTGWGVGLCNFPILQNGIIMKARSRGLRFAWSSEMMWHAEGERGTVMFGWVDKRLYVSPEQRRALEPGYLSAMRICDASECPAEGDLDAPAGLLTAPGKTGIPWVMTGNYVNAASYAFVDRAANRLPDQPLVAGRVSRPDPWKFPEDFPASLRELGLANARFRVLGWSEKLDEVWPRGEFDDRWELLPAGSVPVDEFLRSLDLFIYEVRPELSESWGRAVVEAMLCGAVPLVPADRRHHLHRLVPHGTAGFHCASREDFGHYSRLLEADTGLRDRMSREARRFAEEELCHAADHLSRWRMVFED